MSQKLDELLRILVDEVLPGVFEEIEDLRGDVEELREEINRVKYPLD